MGQDRGGRSIDQSPARAARFAWPSLRVVACFIAILAVYLGMLAASQRTAIQGDGYYTYLWARTIVFDGDLDFHDDYRLCGDPWGLANNPIGDDVNYWSLGPALFWGPILAFDRLTGHPALASDDPRVAGACHGPMAERAVRGSLVAGLLALLMGFAIARRYVSEGPALFGVAGIALLGSLMFYATTMLSYGHAASSCAAGLAVLAWERYRRAPSARRWVLMGGALGLAMLVRAQNAIIVILPLGTWLHVAWARRTSARALLLHVCAGFAFTAALLVMFFPQLWFWHASTGSWVTIPQGSGYMRWGGSMPHKALFSAQGLLAWTPIHYLAIAGFVALAARRTTRTLGVAMLALFAVESFVVGAAYDWAGSVGFPGRRFAAMVVPFIVGLAAFAGELQRWAWRRPAGGVAVLAAGTLGVLGFWNASVTAGVARMMRTDTPRRSLSQWQQTYSEGTSAIWHAVGNPFTWPASLPFALRYGVHPRRWDVVGAPELFHHDERTLTWRPIESTLDFTSPRSALYLDGQVDDRATEARGRRGIVARPGVSRVLLPLHSPSLGSLAWRVTPLRADAAVQMGMTLDGVRLGSSPVPARAGAEVRFAVPAGLPHQGINELWIWIDGGSILLERLQLLDPVPPPSDWARQENERLRTVRRRRHERAE